MMNNFIALLSFFLLCLSFAEPSAFSASIGAGTDFPTIGSIQFQDKDEIDIALEKAEKDLNSNKSFEITSAIKFFRDNLDQLLKNGKFKPETLKRLESLLASPSENINAEANHFFEDHMPALFNNSIITSSTLTGYSENVYNSETDFQIFLGLMNSLLKNKMITRDYVSSEYGYNIIDGLTDSNNNVNSMSTRILKIYGADLTNKQILEQPHIARFIAILKELPKNLQSNYLSVFEANLKNWVSSGLMTKDDFQSILSATSHFSEDLHDQMFAFMTRPDTISTLQSLGMFSRSWVDQLKKDISSGNGPAKQNSLDMLAFFLPAFVKSGTLTGADFRELWHMIDSDMEAFSDPFAIHKKNYRLLSQAGWFVRNDYEKLLINFEGKSVHTQIETLKYFDTVYDWLRLRNWLGTSELTKAIESPTGHTLELRKLGFKPLAKAVLSDDTQVKPLEEKKVEFVGSHIDSILDNDLFSPEHISSFIKKLQSTNPDVYNRAIQVLQEGLGKWYKLGSLKDYHLTELFDHTNINADKTAGLIEAYDNHFEEISPLFTKDMIGTLILCLDSGNSSVQDAAKDFFVSHRDTIESKKLASYSANSTLKAYFKPEKDKQKEESKKATRRYSKNGNSKIQKHNSFDNEELIGD